MAEAPNMEGRFTPEELQQRLDSIVEKLKLLAQEKKSNFGLVAGQIKVAIKEYGQKIKNPKKYADDIVLLDEKLNKSLSELDNKVKKAMDTTAPMPPAPPSIPSMPPAPTLTPEEMAKLVTTKAEEIDTGYEPKTTPETLTADQQRQMAQMKKARTPEVFKANLDLANSKKLKENTEVMAAVEQTLNAMSKGAEMTTEQIQNLAILMRLTPEDIAKISMAQNMVVNQQVSAEMAAPDAGKKWYQKINWTRAAKKVSLAAGMAVATGATWAFGGTKWGVAVASTFGVFRIADTMETKKENEKKIEEARAKYMEKLAADGTSQRETMREALISQLANAKDRSNNLVGVEQKELDDLMVNYDKDPQAFNNYLRELGSEVEDRFFVQAKAENPTWSQNQIKVHARGLHGLWEQQHRNRLQTKDFLSDRKSVADYGAKKLGLGGQALKGAASLFLPKTTLDSAINTALITGAGIMAKAEHLPYVGDVLLGLGGARLGYMAGSYFGAKLMSDKEIAKVKALKPDKISEFISASPESLAKARRTIYDENFRLTNPVLYRQIKDAVNQKDFERYVGTPSEDVIEQGIKAQQLVEEDTEAMRKQLSSEKLRLMAAKGIGLGSAAAGAAAFIFGGKYVADMIRDSLHGAVPPSGPNVPPLGGIAGAGGVEGGSGSYSGPETAPVGGGGGYSGPETAPVGGGGGYSGPETAPVGGGAGYTGPETAPISPDQAHALGLDDTSKDVPPPDDRMDVYKVKDGDNMTHILKGGLGGDMDDTAKRAFIEHHTGKTDVSDADLNKSYNHAVDVYASGEGGIDKIFRGDTVFVKDGKILILDQHGEPRTDTSSWPKHDFESLNKVNIIDHEVNIVDHETKIVPDSPGYATAFDAKSGQPLAGIGMSENISSAYHFTGDTEPPDGVSPETVTVDGPETYQYMVEKGMYFDSDGDLVWNGNNMIKDDVLQDAKNINFSTDGRNMLVQWTDKTDNQHLVMINEEGRITSSALPEDITLPDGSKVGIEIEERAHAASSLPGVIQDVGNNLTEVQHTNIPQSFQYQGVEISKANVDFTMDARGNIIGIKPSGEIKGFDPSTFLKDDWGENVDQTAAQRGSPLDLNRRLMSSQLKSMKLDEAMLQQFRNNGGATPGQVNFLQAIVSKQQEVFTRNYGDILK